MVVELVAALAITSVVCLGLLKALVQCEEAEISQEVEMGVLAQLRYQTTIVRGLPISVLNGLFGSGSTIVRNGPNDQKLYGILNPPSRTASVSWQLGTAALNADTGEPLFAVTVTVQAPLSVGGGIMVTRQATVYRALE